MTKKKLTQLELDDVQDYIDNELIEDKKAIKILAARNCFTRKELRELEKLQRRIERGEIKNRNNKTVTVEDFMNITRLNRGFTPENFLGIVAGERCPLDPTYVYADQFGGKDATE